MPSYRGRERESALNALAGGVPVHPSSPRTTPGPLQRATAAHEAWLRTSAEGELCLYLSECFGSATPLAEQLGGLQIIAAVVNSAADDDDISGPSVLITNLANCLRVPLSSTEPSVLAAATLAFGRLARVGAAAEPVVAELRRALGRLSAGSKLDSATLVVREVALAAPSLLYVHVAAIFGSIWPAFRDARAAVRQSAAEALDAVLQIVAERPSAARGGWYAAARGEALTALRSGSAEAVHGGLLAAAALLSGGTPYDGKACEELLEAAWPMGEHRDRAVRLAFVGLLPHVARRLVADAESERRSLHLSRTADHLLATVRGAASASSAELRAAALLACGSLAAALAAGPPSAGPPSRLPAASVHAPPAPALAAAAAALPDRLVREASAEVVALLRRDWRGRRAAAGAVGAAAVACVAQFAVALPALLDPLLDTLLPLLLGCDLSQELSATLATLCECAPRRAADLQEGVLSSVSHALSRRSYTEWRRLPCPARAAAAAATVADADAAPAAILALSTLGAVAVASARGRRAAGVGGKLSHSLLEFASECAAAFFLHADPAVREAAAASCLRQLSAANLEEAAAPPAVGTDLLLRVLSLGVADPEPRVRSCIFGVLSAEFDAQLASASAMPDALRAVCAATHDSAPEARRAAVAMVGRLAARAPLGGAAPLGQAAVQRATLDLLSETQLSATPAQRELAAELLEALVGTAGPLVAPSAPRILRALESALADPSPRVGAAALGASSQTVLQGGAAVRPAAAELISLSCEFIRDDACAAHRRAGLAALSRLVRATADARAPYLREPGLLSRLLFLLRMERHAGTRLELLRLLGALGAYDPFIESQEALERHRRAATAAPIGDGEEVERWAAQGRDDHQLVELPLAVAAADWAVGSGPSSSDSDGWVAADVGSLGFYHSLALRHISRRLDDSTFIPARREVLPALCTLLCGLRSARAAPHLRIVLPLLCGAFSTADARLRAAILQHLSSLTASCGEAMARHTPRLMDLVCLHWTDHWAADHSGAPAPVARAADAPPLPSESLLPPSPAGSPSGSASSSSYFRGSLWLLRQSFSGQVGQAADGIPGGAGGGGADAGGGGGVGGGGGADRAGLWSGTLVAEVAKAGGGALFESYLPRLLPPLLRALHAEHSAGQEWGAAALRLLGALSLSGGLAGSLHPCLHLALPALSELADAPDAPLGLREDALALLASLLTDQPRATVEPLAACVVHAQLRLLAAAPAGSSLAALAVGVLHSLVYALGEAPLSLERMVRQAVQPHDLGRPLEALLSAIAAGADYRDDPALAPPTTKRGSPSAAPSAGRAFLLHHESRRNGDAAAWPAPAPPNFGAAAALGRRFPMDARSLAAAWDTRQRSTAEDWAEWFRAFALATLRESPSPALRCLSALAERVPSLAFDLFDASLYACWEELASTATGEAAESSSALAAALQAAMEAESMPTALLGRLLSAADFCERAGTPLDISWRTLGALAQRGSAWAKALRYRESEWEWAHPSCVAPEVVAIHMALDKREEARGVLHAAREREAAAGRMAGSARGAWGGRGGPRSRLLTMPAELTVAVDADNAHLREQLHDWKEALGLYEAREAPGDAAPLDSLGRMRCHAALGEWEAVRRLSDKLAEQRAVLAPGEVAELARLGAAAALDMASHATAGNERHWAALGRHAALLPARSFDGAFSRAVLALHGGDWSGAQAYIDAARGVIDAEVTGLVGESYARAYNGMVRLQRLSELEEVLLNATSPTTLPRARLLELWRGRLGHAAADLSAWRELLPVRALAVPPRHDPHGMIAFAQLCSRNGQHTLAFEALRHAEPRAAASWGDAPDMQPDVWLAYTVAMWESGEGGARDDALSRLRGYLRERGGPLGPADPRSATERCLAASGWVHLGEWTLASAAPAAGEASLLEHFRRAAELDPASCAAWHNLAMVHFDHVRCTCWRSEDELGEHHRHHPDPGATDTEERVVAALECLFRCISLRPSSSPTGHTQQDILTLLTLAFEHGETEGAAAALSRGLADTPAETWLAVVPQVIARLGSESERVRTFVLSLLSTLAERHPQGLVYPLTVAATSPLRAQATGAAHILAHLRRGRDVLVEQAQLVAAELVRASCLWSEAWIDGLETASKAFYTEGDDAGCVRALLPLHEALERGAQTPAEGAFVREFGGALDAARAELRQWQESGERAHLHSAWALYMGLFRAVSPRQAALTSLDLASVSPRLLGATALELAVPGTYEPQAPLVTISGFRPRLSVIASKQRPRRVMLAGDDGREYSFLLKGREDLRQDERVMQLFGLVNRLLGSTAPLAGPAIRRYAVVPLSPASGLIGWVPSCDTLHQLVRHHRESRGVPLYLEHRIAAQLAPEPKRGGDGGDGGGGLAEGGELRAYNALPLLHRVEVFAAALSRTGGRDLAEALWLRSPSAEWWLERRSSYTRSVGVMCVVGYILGLGDRHLNNMLLDRVSGEVVHIDYGDCFEAAALRPRFPETVPFRLTRMLVTAMGVAGVDGVYRSTCEGAMRALRRHRSSVLAMLEAFLYDPLVHWNLDGAERGSAKRVSSRASLDGGEARGGAARGDKVMHAQALRVLRRVKSKLDGSEFGAAPIDVPTQVDRLVHEAQAHTNLAQMWGGWNPFW